MSVAFKHSHVLLPGLMAMALGCGGSDLVLPSEGVAAKIVVVSGNGQAGVVGTPLVDSVTVRVTDTKDRPVQNQQVTFAPGDANSGQPVPTSATTNADGRAGAKWVLGPVAGSQTVVAKAVGNGAPASLSVTFTATASSSVPAKLEKSAGDGQHAQAGTAVATAPAVKITDPNGNPVAGVGVTFQVTGGGGTVVPTTPVATNASGIAAATSWTLGAVAGPNQLTASVAASGVTGNPAVFTATGDVGGANKLAFVVEPVNAAVGAPITPAVKVQVQDAAGNPVTTATNAITLTLGTNPTGATLGGTTTVNAVNGTATFPDLTLDRPGTGYTLSAAAPLPPPGLTGTTSAAFSVVMASSITTVTGTNPGSTVVGQPYAVSFTVAAAPPASGTPSGTVTVSDGAGATCTGAAPTGSCSLTSTVAGAKAVVATYAGDASFAGSASTPLNHTVAPAATTITITGDAPDPSDFGDPVTVTYSVTIAAPGSGSPTGTVAVTYGGVQVCPPQAFPATNQCVFTPSSTGTKNLRATFAPGTGDFSGDQSPNEAHTVNPGTTSTSLVSNNNPSNVGEQVGFTATVSVLTGTGTPSGTVAFKDGGSTLATVALVNGTASTTQAFLVAGEHDITAVYSGDAGFSGSTSAVLKQQVNILNLPPTANNDTYSTNEDTQLNVPAGSGVLSNDTDPNNDPLTAIKVSGPTNGTLSLNANGSFTYTPAANYNGPDSFTYQASDGTFTSNVATVNLTVNPVNDPPSFSLAGSDINVSAAAGPQTVPGWATNISAGPPNEAFQTVSFIVTVALSDKGSFTSTGLPAIDGSGTLTYEPDPGAAGNQVTVTVTAQDNGGTANGGQNQSAPQNFTITITP
jgi:Big-like domain-containing protein